MAAALGGLVMGILLLLCGCTTDATTGCRVDWAQAEREGRVVEFSPPLPRTYTARTVVDAAPLAWTGSVAPLRSEGSRIVATVSHPSGASADFVVDTGSSFSAVSACSALASHFTLIRRGRASWGSAPGRPAILRTLRMGDMGTRDLPLVAVERAHSLKNPMSVLGMTALSGLALTFDRARRSWSLAPSGRTAVPGVRVRMAAPGVPVVRVRSARGTYVLALIDTGAPRTLVTAEMGGRELTIIGENGVSALTAQGTIGRLDGLVVAGRPIACLLGLDTLSRASSVFDFGRGTWVLQPR